MKTIVTMLISIVLLSACSSPKYTYNFDYYDYNSGKKKAEGIDVAKAGTESNQRLTEAAANVQSLKTESPLAVSADEVVASADVKAPSPLVAKNASGKKLSEMTKAEKKEFKKAVKAEVKNLIKGKKGDVTKDTKAMDYNLKMAIIFGAIALTLSFFGGVNSIFWIASVIALVIGVVFFIKWIAEQ